MREVMQVILATRSRRRRQCKWSGLGLLLVILGGVLPRATLPAAAPNGVSFVRHEVVIDAATTPRVLTGRFFGRSWAEIATVNIGDSEKPVLRIHAFDGQRWQLALETRLGADVQFIDVARIGGHDRLLTYSPGELRWFDPDSLSEIPLLDARIDFRSRHDNVIPQIDISRDLNLDARDDIVLPDVDGFWISTQRGDGSFTDAVRFGPEEPFRNDRIGNLDLEEPGLDPDTRYGDVGITAFTAKWYLSRVHTMDHNLDGRVDLVFWSDGQLNVHYQDEQSQFAAAPKAIPAGVPIDADGVHARAFDHVDDGVGKILFGLGAKSTRTFLRAIHDMSGDGIEDLVTVTLSGRSIARQQSTFSVFNGEPSDDGLRFSSQASTRLKPRGKAGAMQSWGYSSQWFEDIDGDGITDILFRNVNVGLGGMARALAGKSVSIDLEYFRLSDGAFPKNRGVRHKIRPSIRIFEAGGPFFPAVLIGDVNGDGIQDLIYGKNRELLLVHPGIPGLAGFAETPVEISIPLPNDERDTRLVDINGDGKQDILILHRSDDASIRLSLLLAGHEPARPMN